MQQTKNLILLDINSHLHRAYNRAYGLLKNTNQVPHINSLIQDSVNLIENELTKLQRQGITTDYIACIIDASGKNFRHELYEEYKANRPPKIGRASCRERVCMFV